MKAAIYNPYLDTLGGGERYTLTFAQVLLDSGWDVDLAWKDTLLKEKLKARFGLNLEKLRIVGDINKGNGYDLCFWVSDGSIPLLHSRNNILHFQVPFRVDDGRSLLNKMKFFRINHNVCNSNFTKNIIDVTFGVNSKVIYPPVDVENFVPKRKDNVILSVGRFSQLKQAKRQDILISAFAKLSKELDKSWRLVFAGGVEVGVGKYLGELKKKAEKLPVEFVLSPSFKSLVRLYGSAKIFWSASGFGVDEEKNPEKVEHFGITTVESMAAGCIPFVFGAGGAREIIQNEHDGYLWHNTNELVKQTLMVVYDKELQKNIADNATRSCKRFGKESFEQEVLEIIK